MENVANLHEAYLALGTNLGNREANIVEALKNIENRVGMVISHSAFYETEPVGFESEHKFINAACLIMTSLTPLELLLATQEIEKNMGRDSKSYSEVYTDRIIDIDILCYEDLILDEGDLILPHPHMHKRYFVLAPLSEFAGYYIHPVLNKTIDELFDELTNQ